LITDQGDVPRCRVSLKPIFYGFRGRESPR
jgi:hypothetical protein